MSETEPARWERAVASLQGLSVGDAFGDQWFRTEIGGEEPEGPWRWTDDTAMALSIVETLRAHGAIDQDVLAAGFVDRTTSAASTARPCTACSAGSETARTGGS